MALENEGIALYNQNGFMANDEMSMGEPDVKKMKMQQIPVITQLEMAGDDICPKDFTEGQGLSC